ncbi:SufS family cysteine desulfurase [Planctomicrobium sp. SH664]|uniref:SufS family cysteine desulfurase n=1 Tax=Planctomicrobium sp. SH664 TaxID=3448125 RepID=UPI003F5AEB33
MHELTPEKLTEITTKLFQQLPGMQSVPQSAWPGGPDPDAAATTDFLQQLPLEAGSGGLSADPLPHISESLVAAARRISARQPVGTRPGSGTSTRASSGSGSGGAGLRSFVQGIQTSHISREPSWGQPGEEEINSTRLFGGRSPVRESARAFDVAAIRRDFPILRQSIHGHPLVWMDNAATTQKPQCVIDELSRFYATDNSNIHRGAHSLAARATDAYEDARQKVQKFLGAGSPQEIVFVRGTTEGINLITQTCGRKFLQPGDEIVLTTLEHHANIVPWQMVARETGAVIRVVPVNDSGEILLEEYQRLLGPRTRVAAFTHANNSLGTLLPVAEMTRMAKRYGARVLIDGAQSVAHIPVNVQELGCDFYVFSGHKIFGPTGIGAAYVRSELLEIMPPWQGGGSMIKNVTFEETTYSDPPAKFEAGTPNIADAVGLGAALDYVTQLGLPQIARHEHQLLEYATDKLSSINGLRLIGSARDKVSVISFVMQNRPTEEIGRLLDREGIAVRSGHHCAQPSLRRFGLETTVRPSFSIYNTYDEIDHLVSSLKRIEQRSPSVSRVF